MENDRETLPAGFRSDFSACGEVRLHVVHNARSVRADGVLRDDRPALLLLHGFPEYWAGWRGVMAELAADYLILAPDQRGYNRSDAPGRLADYAARKLVSDALALACNLIGARKFHLAGHDWGAAVAYALAISVPERVKSLTIANGVHPVPFQKALVEDPAQSRASQYFHVLTAPDAAARMSEDNFRRTFSMFEKFSATPWLDEAMRADYRRAWSRPGRLEAMLNWYRASPIQVPKPGEPLPPTPLRHADPARFTVAAPHLLIWGERDQALLPSSTAGLERFAPRLERVNLPDADHWLLHSHAKPIAAQMKRFIDRVEAETPPARTRR